MKRPDPVPAEPLSPQALKPSAPRSSAAKVLNSLIDARLLTSYEIPPTDEGGEPHHRIEIVHESLLARWPRLVRWQRQDADSAQMRDELRSQAQLWDEHGRSEDYLWTGTAFKEYELWRERYTGGEHRRGRVCAKEVPVTDFAATEVLNTLIDARLLTSYEVPAADEEDTPHHRIEIIHESLLSNWPRLVRWQTQDADSAQLRDQIRQAAQMWEERGRPEDLLWTGTSFGEYRLWLERYEGGLSTAEEEFGAAMDHLAERQKRRRRIAVGAATIFRA